MLLREYRVAMPLTPDQFQIGQLYGVCMASLQETGGGDGVQLVTNEPYVGEPLFNGQYDRGQYTHKIYYLNQKLPWLVRKLAPKGSLIIHEKAWNAFPYCKTVLTNPDYMKKNFYIEIHSLHLPDNGSNDNALMLTDAELKKRKVINLDITDEQYLNKADLTPDTDPRLFQCEKTKRGPLQPGWASDTTQEPVMCCYKVVKAHFKWKLMQQQMEQLIQRQYPRLFTKFHRQTWCWADKWLSLGLEDIRAMERRLVEELEQLRRQGPIRGTVADDD